MLNLKNLAKNITGRLGAPVGGAAAALVDKVVPASVNPKIVSIGKIALGTVIPEFAPKSKFMESAGAGFAGAGAQDLVRDMLAANNAPVNGIGADEDYAVDQDVNGADDESLGSVDNESLGNTDSPMSGVGSDEEEYEVGATEEYDIHVE